jgi:hypothetical protein
MISWVDISKVRRIGPLSFGGILILKKSAFGDYFGVLAYENGRSDHGDRLIIKIE